MREAHRLKTKHSFNAAEENPLEHSLYNTGITPKYGQQILTLSTCYARYTAFVPDATRMVEHLQYSSLDEYDREMIRIVDKYTKLAVENQSDGEYNLDLDEVYDDFKFREFNQNLFLDMLRERPEFDNISYSDAVYTAMIARDYLSKDEYYRLYQIDVDIMEAKHILWMHSAGGEQADFRGCEMDGIDFSSKNFSGAIFDDSIITNSMFENAILMGASFNQAEIHTCSFKNVSAEEVKANDASFIDCDFTQADFIESSFVGTRFDNCSYGCISIENSCIKDTEFHRTKPDQEELDKCYTTQPDSEQNENMKL